MKSPSSLHARKTPHPQNAPRTDVFAVALSWAVVAAIALLVFFMSAKDGTTLDTGSGLLSAAKQALAGALSSIAGKPVDVSPIGHFVEYFALGAALANALRFHMPLRRACVWAGIAASLYGISDEIHQAFVPLRSCDPLDWAVDTVAAAIGAAVLATLVARGTNGARKPGERPLMKHDEADRKSGIPHRPR